MNGTTINIKAEAKKAYEAYQRQRQEELERQKKEQEERDRERIKDFQQKLNEVIPKEYQDAFRIDIDINLNGDVCGYFGKIDGAEFLEGAVLHEYAGLWYVSTSRSREVVFKEPGDCLLERLLRSLGEHWFGTEEHK